MSVFPTETIDDILNTTGMALPETSKQTLLQDSEYRLRQLIIESTKFMHKSKRSRLETADINAALEAMHYEPIYPSYSAFKQIGELYFLDDSLVDLQQILSQPLKPVPHEPVFTGHWLAIEGVQPRIVQNPTTSTLKKELPAKQAPVEQVKQILTKELQLYYEFIVEKLESNPELAIQSVSSDPGIQGLMPYFVQFITETVTKNLGRLEANWTMMRFVRALLTNPDIFCEPYLHQLVPSILTCILTKRLSLPGQDHYTLREYSAKLLKHICKEYGQVYQTLEPRATKTLLRGLLDPQKPLSSVYGALVGLWELVGVQGMDLLLIPNILLLEQRINATRDEEAERLDKEIRRVLKDYVGTKLQDTRREQLEQEFEKAFGSYAELLRE